MRARAFRYAICHAECQRMARRQLADPSSSAGNSKHTTDQDVGIWSVGISCVYLLSSNTSDVAQQDTYRLIVCPMASFLHTTCLCSSHQANERMTDGYLQLQRDVNHFHWKELLAFAQRLLSGPIECFQNMQKDAIFPLTVTKRSSWAINHLFAPRLALTC